MESVGVVNVFTGEEERSVSKLSDVTVLVTGSDVDLGSRLSTLPVHTTSHWSSGGDSVVVGILSVSSAPLVWKEVWECDPERVLTEFNPFDVVPREEEATVVVETLPLPAFVGVDPVLTSSLVSG